MQVLSRLPGWRRSAAALAGAAAGCLRLLPRAAGLGMRAPRVHPKAWALALAAAFAGAHAATPANTAIVNTATASFRISGVPIAVTGAATVVTSAGTPATIALMSSVDGANVAPGVALTSNIAPTQCMAGAGWSALPAPVTPGQGTLSVPGDHQLAAATMYASGDVVLVQVTDLDQNRDAGLRETIEVTVTTAGGDSENLRLTESGNSSGVFIGYIQTVNAAVQAGNCRLEAGPNERLTARYVDASENNTVLSAVALIDPFGIVFDSATGAPVNDVRVTLIDMATGLPASVFGNDGVSSFPSSVRTGTTVTDSSGASYAFAPGRYQFPRVAPGSYRFQLETPPGYRFPSQASNAAIQALPAAPFALATGSRGEVFAVLPGPALEIDLPLDPGPLGELNITKSAGKAVAAIGDFVPYTLVLASRVANPLSDVRIVDRLPPGFRYVPGSARLEAQPLADPQVAADGRTLEFAVGTLAANATVTVRYVTNISAGAKAGPAHNTAQAVGRIASNTASATVMVREDLNRSRAILMGRVMATQSCAQDERAAGAVQGLAGVRILLQDGTAITTDAEGNWHADNLRPGTHVVQVDTTTLPPGAEFRNCDPSSRTGGRDFSQMVNVRGGTLWRADFRLLRTGREPAAKAPAAPRVEAEATAAPASLVEKLPYDDKWLAAAPAGNEWLHPRTGFTPALPAIKVAVKHVRGSQVDLRVNGAAVDPLRYEGTVLSPTGELQLSHWRAVDLREGANVLDVAVRDAAGQVLLQESRSIHYAVGPASVRFDAARSSLVADGRSLPTVAVQLLDRNGKPVRRGVAGQVDVEPPHLPQQLADALQREPLSGLPGGRARFEVGEDGIALVALQPTMQSGEAVLRFDFGDNRQHEVRAWLQADLRDWVMVGFAEGTLGHKRLSGNLEALRDSEAGDQLFDQDRVAFYAKGRVKGEYLLTVAYDSAKEKPAGGERVLRQAIDPNQYYTLYGDGTQPGFDAASTSKLYLRIEKKQFYALFGDYDTGLTVTELGRYSRTFTGLKSGYKGETFGYTAFAARTDQSFMKDELQGDGTSGIYRLRARGIVLNSEKVRIEVRDRFQPDRVLATRALVPFIDYRLDPEQGTLTFREPVASRDTDLNLQFIVVDYETRDRGQAGFTYGGRVAAKVGKDAEVGLTHVREGNTGREGQLTAADATLRLGEGTRVRAEVATSHAHTGNGRQEGNAYLLEATHDDGRTAARAYASEQQPGFGLGQQSLAAAGQRKVGAEARHKLADNLQLQGEAYRQQDLAGGGRRDVAEGRAQWSDTQGLTVNAGARVASETDNAGNVSEARQLTGGAAYEMMERKLVLRASTDLDVGSRGTANFPSRLVLGVDYRLTPETTLIAQHEIARGELLRANTTRIGLRTQLWKGGELQLGAGNQQAGDAMRTYANMGLVQKLKISEHWSADFGVDRVQTLRTTVNPLGPAQPLASGTPSSASYGILTGDHSAVTLGVAYHDPVWSGNARAEWRDSSTDTKVNLLAGAQRKLGQGRVVALGIASYATDTHGAGADARQVTARLSHAYRPSDSRWAFLQRVEYVEDASQNLAGRLFTRKLIAHFNANLKAGPRTQVALQYGAKYVRETLGDASYGGYTDLWGFEARHDLDERWDIGLHAGSLNAWRTGTHSWQLGLSVGYRLADNTWVSVGYNHLGFRDGDFAGSQYRAQGVYVNLRMKFDETTFDLNDRTRGELPLKP